MKHKIVDAAGLNPYHRSSQEESTQTSLSAERPTEAAENEAVRREFTREKPDQRYWDGSVVAISARLLEFHGDRSVARFADGPGLSRRREA